MSKAKQIFAEELKIMEDHMDKRDHFFELMDTMLKEQKPIPAKYQNDPAIMLNLTNYQAFGGWRNQMRVVLRVRQAARKSAKKRMK
jgi:hypothetical protein